MIFQSLNNYDKNIQNNFDFLILCLSMIMFNDLRSISIL